LFAAAQEFYRAWHPLRGNVRLKGRRPREIEVRLTLKTGDSLRLYFAGKKTIDQLLSGRPELIEKLLRRTGVTPDMLTSEQRGGALSGVQFAVSGLQPRDGAGARVRTGVPGRMIAIRQALREEQAAPDQDLVKIALLQAELDALSKQPRTNKEAMARFATESVYAAEKRLEELGPRGAYEAAVKLASKTGSGVELKVDGDRIPIAPQVRRGDTASVQKIHRKRQDADVDVLRSQQTGRFVSAVPDAAKLRILERAQREGFSKVARETGIKRTTIYEWRKLQES
jgi:hypothetical protein